MSFQSYLDNIEEKTGLTPRAIVEKAQEAGFDATTKATPIVQWLADEYGLGRGHAMAIVHLITRGTTINEKHVGSDGASRRVCRAVDRRQGEQALAGTTARRRPAHGVREPQDSSGRRRRWGVDALLGHQTRVHGDLDLAVEQTHALALDALLSEFGYSTGEDGTPDNYVVTGPAGCVDLHLYCFVGDEEGASIGIAYPRASLTGVGRIGELQVACTAREWVLEFHRRYELDAKGIADVAALETLG